MSDQTLARFRAKQVTLADGRRGQSETSRLARAPLNLLLGVTAVVLLIACANIANLLLARGAARAGEMSVRLAIGASRWQLVAQLLTESCVLAVLGGAAGLLVARWTLDGMVSLLPADAAAATDFGLDRTAVLFAAVVTLATGVLFGLFPAMHSTQAGSGLRAQRSGRPALRRQGSAAVPRHARDRPDRAVDGAARLGGAVHEEPAERQPGGPWPRGGQRGDVHAVAGSATATRSRRRGSSSSVSKTTSRRCPASPAVTDALVAAARRQQLGQQREGAGVSGGARHRHRIALQRDRPRLLSDARHPDARRPRLHARPTPPARRKWRSSTRPSPESSTSDATPSASA